MGYDYKFGFTPEYVIFNLCNAQTKKNSTVSKKGEITIVCPYTNKTFDVNLAKGGAWKCFKECSNCPTNGGGILDFYRLYHNCSSNKEALEAINSYAGIKQMKKRDYNAIKSEMIKAVDTVTQLDAKLLNTAYTAFLDELTLSEIHQKDLLKRGMSQEDIEAVGFKSIPQVGVKNIVSRLKEKGITLKGVPGFYEEKGETKLNVYGSGFFIPHRNQNGEIVSLQIRRDVTIDDSMSEKQIREAKSKRYRWLTSSSYENGTGASNVPFYGIPNKSTKDVVYITEGGLKAATAQSLSGGWFVSIPGVSCYSALRILLANLEKKGITTVVDAFDSDRATNESVNNAIQKIHRIAKEEFGIEMKSWDWGTEYKGVDDYLLAKKESRKKKITRPVFPTKLT